MEHKGAQPTWRGRAMAVVDDAARLPGAVLPEETWNDAQLKVWREALAGVASKPADVLILGDSVSEGYFSSSDQTRWLARMRKRLQQLYNPSTVPGGEGYVAATHSADPGVSSNGNAPLPQRWTLSGVTAAESWSSTTGFGLGRRSVTLNASTDYAEIAVACDRFWLTFLKGAAGRTAEILIDNVVVGTIDTYGTALGSIRYDSGAIARGTHTIRVRPINTGSAGGAGYSVFLEGIMVFDGDGGNAPNVGAGVRVWDGAHAGLKASDFMGPGTGAAGYWAEAVNAHISPDLVILSFGANEANQGVSTATFEANLGTLVDYIRSRATTSPSILIWAIPGTAAVTSAVWQTYRDALARVATTKNCAFLDVTQRLPFPIGNATPTPIYSDAAHFTDGGALEVARIITQHIADVPIDIPPLPPEVVGYVVHGAVAGTARPANYGVVIWIGSVAPTNAINNDIWHNTA